MYTNYEVYKRRKKETLKKSLIKYFIKVIIVSTILILIIEAYFLKGYRIVDASMEPLIREKKDAVLVNKLSYGLHLPFTDKRIFSFNKPKKNDIVLFKEPYHNIYRIKRIIALPHESIEIKNKRIIVNGIEIKRVKTENTNSIPRELSQRDNLSPYIIPEDNFFLLGDNRDKSYDSRWYGTIPFKNIIGRVILRYKPLKRWKWF